MATRSALISGASIAGPALAFWLSEAGWDVTVIERADRLRDSGYPVDVRGTAIDVVERMGLRDEIAAQHYRHGPITLLSHRGRRLSTFDIGGLLSDPGRGDVEIIRGVLTEILYRAGRDRADYIFGDSIASLTQTDTGVDVTFDHHPPRTFDVVIGADGIHSKVRALTFGDESQFIRHLGACAAIWDLPDEMFAPGAGFMYSHPGRTAIVGRFGDGAQVRAFLTFVHPNPGSVNRYDTDEIHRAFREGFAGDRWRTAEIIDTLPAANDLYFDTVSQIRMDRWSSGRVALVGDAAYAPAFLSGQGTSIAIAGAYLLASELARHDRPEAAFAAYERRLRDYVERNQDLALRTDSTVIARTKGQLLLRNITLGAVPVLQRLGLAQLLQTNLRSAATDLSLSSHDLQRCTEAAEPGRGTSEIHQRRTVIRSVPVTRSSSSAEASRVPTAAE